MIPTSEKQEKSPLSVEVTHSAFHSRPTTAQSLSSLGCFQEELSDVPDSPTHATLLHSKGQRCLQQIKMKNAGATHREMHKANLKHEPGFHALPTPLDHREHFVVLTNHLTSTSFLIPVYTHTERGGKK